MPEMSAVSFSLVELAVSASTFSGARATRAALASLSSELVEGEVFSAEAAGALIFSGWYSSAADKRCWSDMPLRGLRETVPPELLTSELAADEGADGLLVFWLLVLLTLVALLLVVLSSELDRLLRRRLEGIADVSPELELELAPDRELDEVCFDMLSLSSSESSASRGARDSWLPLEAMPEGFAKCGLLPCLELWRCFFGVDLRRRPKVSPSRSSRRDSIRSPNDGS